MKPARRKPSPDPERVRVRLEQISQPEAQRGGYVYRAVAQVYGAVNDRLMRFLPGSGAKTIGERVPLGRVKIHDGHPWCPDSETTVGYVLSAAEDAGGVTYEGFISSAEEDLVTKMQDGTIDENSLEVIIVRETIGAVPVEQVPPISRRWASLRADGLVEVREIQEWMWLAIGLVGASSQGVAAILDTPELIPYQDLPVAASSAAWDPAAAAARLTAWAADPGLGGVNLAKQSRAFLARGRARETGALRFLGQIADVVDGELVVIPEALARAYGELQTLVDPSALAAAGRTIGRYEGRLRALTSTAARPQDATATELEGISTPAAAPLASAASATVSQSATAGPAQPPTGTTSGDDDGDSYLRLAKLRSVQAALALLDTGGATSNEPARPGPEPAAGGRPTL